MSRDLKEEITELLLEHEELHKYVTDQARADLELRSLFRANMSKEAWDELVCMGQIKFMAKFLVELAYETLS